MFCPRLFTIQLLRCFLSAFAPNPSDCYVPVHASADFAVYLPVHSPETITSSHFTLKVLNGKNMIQKTRRNGNMNEAKFVAPWELPIYCRQHFRSS